MQLPNPPSLLSVLWYFLNLLVCWPVWCVCPELTQLTVTQCHEYCVCSSHSWLIGFEAPEALCVLNGGLAGLECVCVFVLGLCSMIKAEGSLGCMWVLLYVCVCVCAGEDISKAQCSPENSVPTELWSYRCTRGIWENSEKLYLFFQPNIYFIPAPALCVCREYLCSVCVCSPGYDKVEKQMSTSEPSRAPGRKSDCKHSGSITPISLLHLDMPPQWFDCYHLVVYPPSAFLCLPLPHFYPCCEPLHVHRWVFI